MTEPGTLRNQRQGLRQLLLLLRALHGDCRKCSAMSTTFNTIYKRSAIYRICELNVKCFPPHACIKDDATSPLLHTHIHTYTLALSLLT